MSTTFEVGDLTIQRIVEQEIPLFDPLTFLPDVTPEILAENRGWLEQAGAFDPATSKLVLCVQSYVVRTPHHTVLVDTCVGNDKNRPSHSFWHQQKSTTYMDGLAAHGLSVEDIDYVMCTHLHVDHVGWNTKLLDGRWVPTFPNARYVFSKKEFDYWAAENAREEVGPIADSVLPIVNANRADLVANDYGLGDHIRMTPTPGHTPDHVAVLLGKGRNEAVLTGDLIHSPLQMRYPDISMRADYDRKQAAVTRRAFLECHCDTGTLVCTGHFPSPSSGKVTRRGDSFDFKVASRAG